jgi:hypothetical protein
VIEFFFFPSTPSLTRYVERTIPEISDQVKADPKTGRTRGKKWGIASEECSLLATKCLGECAVGKTAPRYAASFVTTFVTMECAVSLVCDPTIFISCQS